MAATASASSSKMEYLRKYGFANEEEKKKEHKKKKKKPKRDINSGVIVVDEDPVWQKPVAIVEEEDEEAAEDNPQVDEDIEVKRMKRLEQIRARRPFGSISEDGSGWVSVNNAPSSDRNPDMSPPRRRSVDGQSMEYEKTDLSTSQKQKARYYSPSPESQIMLSANTDLSPPRKRRARNDSSSPEAVARYPRPGAADLSPPRRRHNPDHSPSPSRRRLDSPSGERKNKPSSRHTDLSPPRKQRIQKASPSESELMPSNTRSNDLSAPHKRRARNDSPSPEPEGKYSKKAPADLSPPRRRNRDRSPLPGHRGKLTQGSRSDLKDQDSVDISPPRRGRARYDSLSPRSDIEPRKRVSHSIASDSVSNPVQSHGNKSRSSSAADLSPVRKPRKDRSVSDAAQTSVISDLSPPRKHSKDTSKRQPLTGLVTGQDIKEEIVKTKKEDWSSFKDMDPSISGRGAEGVYRDKLTGKRMSKEEFLKSQKKEEKPKEVKLEWGKGLAQKREAEARFQELEEEKNKPFARNRDDPELDKMLKERLRWGDPMAHLVKKKQLEPVLPDFGDDERMKESGFIVPQDIPSHSWIRRGLDAAPNRYGIKPGRHWDGVDRSTGFEKQMFKRMNEKEATQREAYLWSVSDM